MFKKKFLVAAFLSLAVLSNTQIAYGITYMSSGDGAWTDSATWMPPGVPVLGDIAVIMAPDTVGLASPGGIPEVAVDGLAVFGTIISHFPVPVTPLTAMSMEITSPIIGIAAGGAVTGEDGIFDGGAVIFTFPGAAGPAVTTLGAFMNAGTITAGAGAITGGSSMVLFANGIATNTGTIIGGASDTASGATLFWATTALNF